MFKKILLIISINFSFVFCLQGQRVNLDEYEIFINDTLIYKADFTKNGKKIDSERLTHLTFKPITDGQKKYYYLNGQLSAEGEIKNKKEYGFWVYWHENGQKAREGSFDKGIPTGVHSYWYPNGNLRGVGNFKNGKYDGKWTMYNEDGSDKIEQYYED